MGIGARGTTYAISSASSHVVREAGAVTGVAHHDDGLDLVKCAGIDAGGAASDAGAAIGSTANGVVHDLTALLIEWVSICCTKKDSEEVIA